MDAANLWVWGYKHLIFFRHLSVCIFTHTCTLFLGFVSIIVYIIY